MGIDYYPGTSTNWVMFSVYPSGALTVGRNSVSFNEFDWQETQSITVAPNPSEGDDSVNKWARLAATSSAAYTETLRTRVLIRVLIKDDDQNWVLSEVTGVGEKRKTRLLAGSHEVASILT